MLFRSENVAFGLMIRKTAKREMEKAVAEALAMVNLTGYEGRYPNELSGGQQQRVAILRAIITKPKLLLLDEVTSALDPVLIAEVLSLISELKREGMTMVIATHEMGFAKQVADEVLYLKNGRIVESGQPIQIFEAPNTSELRDFLAALRNAGRLEN